MAEFIDCNSLPKLVITLHFEPGPVQVERFQDALFRVTFHRHVRPLEAFTNSTDQAIDMIQQV